ncbi:PHP domain-containing protein [Kosmotoga sp. DU53]|uniref:PHP domain-containing protein n=1 Tax=Kosmotoga sp. DU53 TaxID=1310160 RepID=UPI0007D8292B|nr:PHP domain-containing protein [Kosmotoga sp. DU53]OAA25541.1 histidinol phosphatase [Kosmotoga sp. DU53]
MIGLGLKKFSCDFHVHTCLSPCADITMTPRAVAEVLTEKGIDWIAVTDHNSAGNVRTFMKALTLQGIKVIPGIEVHTAEDVHLLAYFPDAETAEDYSSWLYDKIPDISIDPEKFGYQLFVNENDEFIGMEEKWLGQPANVKIHEAIQEILKRKGIFAFAHAERRMGILYQLGFIPPVANPVLVEVAFKKTLYEFPSNVAINCLHSSDAHSLNMLKPSMVVECERRTFEAFKKSLLIDYEARVRINWV